MCSMPFTVVVIARSQMVTMRPFHLVRRQPAVTARCTDTTGMLIAGKMSIGVRAMVSAPTMAISTAITTKV